MYLDTSLARTERRRQRSTGTHDGLALMQQFFTADQRLVIQTSAAFVPATVNESVPLQLAQCRFPELEAISNATEYKYIFQIKYTVAILSNSMQKL